MTKLQIQQASDAFVNATYVANAAHEKGNQKAIYAAEDAEESAFDALWDATGGRCYGTS